MNDASSERSGAAAALSGSREIEIKFRADKRAWETLASLPPLKDAAISPAKDLVSTYYDTAEEDLRTHGMALRVRKRGKAATLLGVKWLEGAAGELFSRGEVEVPCPQGSPDLDLFEPEVRARIVEATGPRPLRPVFESRVKRRIALLRHGHSDLELAFDEGVLTAGEARRPISELEIELKDGNPHDLIDFAMELTRAAGLQLEFEAKSDRGYRLAREELPRARKAAVLDLPAAVTFDDLFAAVIANTLQHFVANWAVLRESEAPESVHQLRVALRRMRSALGVFKRIIKLPELEDIRQEAKRIASALGSARESDVFRQNALSGPFGGDATLFKGAPRLLEAVELRRGESYVAARQLIEDPATSRFVLAVQGFCLKRAWRNALAAEDLGLLTNDGKIFAAAVLDRLMRRALKRGRRLEKMSDEERHELRIVLKNLRYSAEFFGGLFEDAKSVRSFLKQIADLQEDLGAHNDAATAQGFMEGLGLPPDPDTHFASGYLLGWYRHATVIADADLIWKWKAFRKADPFWE